MHCTRCGTQLPDEAAFCLQCGQPTQNAGSPPSAAAGQGGHDPAPPGALLGERLSAYASDRDDVEEALWSGGYCSKAMIGTWVGAGFLTIVFLFVPALLSSTPKLWLITIAVILLVWSSGALILCYRKLSVYYELTNQRLIHKSGILRRVTDRIEVIDMDDVAFEQGIIDRFVGVGTIKVTSSDRSHPMLVLKGIDEVGRIAGLMDDARRRERVRRGLHIEAV